MQRQASFGRRAAPQRQPHSKTPATPKLAPAGETPPALAKIAAPFGDAADDRELEQ